MSSGPKPAVSETVPVRATVDELEAKLRHAADEEMDHLAWCTARLGELGARPSLLNPVWYGGACLIGAASGIAGDRWGLGFIEETERQVETLMAQLLGGSDQTGDRKC